MHRLAQRGRQRRATGAPPASEANDGERCHEDEPCFDRAPHEPPVSPAPDVAAKAQIPPTVRPRFLAGMKTSLGAELSPASKEVQTDGPV
jgi:hypothetical protein